MMSGRAINYEQASTYYEHSADYYTGHQSYYPKSRIMRTQFQVKFAVTL